MTNALRGVYRYTYDRNSNRTSKENVLHSDFDEDYTYDNLNRLIDTNRDATDYQAWSLDALGNSNSITTSGVAENRTHNSQNQLTQMGSNSLAFDANGNTTTDQHGRTLVYDGWNRLVEAKNGATSLIRYEYDGLTRRIEEGSTRQYFSAAWQVLEERNASNQVTQSFAWSPVYVDAMIARDRNTVGNATILEGDETGTQLGFVACFGSPAVYGKKTACSPWRVGVSCSEPFGWPDADVPYHADRRTAEKSGKRNRRMTRAKKLAASPLNSLSQNHCCRSVQWQCT